MDTMVACIKAVTGWEASLEGLMQSAERATTLARAFNSREGFSIKDDRLPGRLYDPKPNGPGAGQRIFTREAFEEALRSYYAIVECDPQTGRPSPGKFARMGLEWAQALLDAPR